MRLLGTKGYIVHDTLQIYQYLVQLYLDGMQNFLHKEGKIHFEACSQTTFADSVELIRLIIECTSIDIESCRPIRTLAEAFIQTQRFRLKMCSSFNLAPMTTFFFFNLLFSNIVAMVAEIKRAIVIGKEIVLWIL